MIKLRVILFSLCLLLCYGLKAQYVYGDGPAPATGGSGFDWSDFKERLQPGGNFSLSLGRPTFIDLAPNLAYKITDRLSTGFGLNYSYYDSRGFNGRQYASSIFGSRLFGRVLITEGFFGMAEYERLNVPYLNNAGETKRTSVSAPLVGGGYIQELGNSRGSGLAIMALYNLNYYNTRYSPYLSPIVIRMGFFY